MQELVRGAVAGLVATAPMTWTMKVAERLPTEPWRGRLPPRQITDRMLDKSGLDQHVDEDATKALAIAAHYAFGAAAGSLAAAAIVRSPLPAPVTGSAVGLGVWAASYLGWLPLVGLRRNATQEPAWCNLQMVTAHLVWGAAAGWLFNAVPEMEEYR
ncbi:MAG: hypothetical protein IT424_09055 [Pirellulales bacterium]|nr:hypothetical protein [Pirellulales bacterium]